MCLENLLQISENGCDCLNIPLEDGMLFLDSGLEGRIPLSAAVIDCSDLSNIEMLNDMKINAFKTFNQMLISALTQNGQRYYDISGHLPQKNTYNGTLPIGHPVLLNISTKNIRGLNVEVEITTENHEVVYDENNIPITNPIMLDEGKDHYFKYTPSVAPNNQLIKCGCGGVDHDKYFSVKTALDGTAYESRYIYGYKIKYSVWCDPLKFLCYSSINNIWANTYLHGVLFQWRKSLAYWILSSGMVSNYLITNGDELPALIELYDKKISERIGYLKNTYSGSDCVKCGNISKGAILV